MRWVDIPYEEIDQKLMWQNVIWPQQCPCCGQDHGSEYYVFGTRFVTSNSLKSGSNNFYPVEFIAPYCKVCKRHASINEKSYFVYIVGFLLCTALLYLLFIHGQTQETLRETLGTPLGMLKFLFSGLLIGGGFYLFSESVIMKLIIKFSKSRMKPTCSNHNYAIRASHIYNKIRIQFYRDDYAADFASMNNLVLLMPVEEAIES